MSYMNVSAICFGWAIAVFPLQRVSCEPIFYDENHLDRVKFLNSFGPKVEPVWQLGLPDNILIRVNSEVPGEILDIIQSAVGLREVDDQFDVYVVYVDLANNDLAKSLVVGIKAQWKDGTKCFIANPFDSDGVTFMKRCLNEFRGGGREKRESGDNFCNR